VTSAPAYADIWRRLVAAAEAAGRLSPQSRALNRVLRSLAMRCDGAVLPGAPKDKTNPCFRLLEAVREYVDAAQHPEIRPAKQRAMAAITPTVRAWLLAVQDEALRAGSPSAARKAGAAGSSLPAAPDPFRLFRDGVEHWQR